MQVADLRRVADLGDSERRRSRSGRSLKRLAVASMTSAYLGEPATISVLPLVSKSTYPCAEVTHRIYKRPEGHVSSTHYFPGCASSLLPARVLQSALTM